MASLCNCELWPGTPTGTMEHSITGKGNHPAQEPWPGTSLTLWGTEQLVLQNIPAAQAKKTKWEKLPRAPHSSHRAQGWSSSREGSMQRLGRNPRKPKSLPRSLLWYLAQHRRAK